MSAKFPRGEGMTIWPTVYLFECTIYCLSLFVPDEPCNVTLSLYINSIDSVDEQTMVCAGTIGGKARPQK